MVNPNFRISELIATGGMANIYRGVQVSLDRPIAVKRLHPHLTSNIDFVARFEKEAKSVARLRHENIVSIIDFGKDEEGYYLAMEYVEGKNLKEILKTEKKVPAEIGIIIAEEVAQGLRYAHSAGLVHRDIKPANIMLSSYGGVKITDFGIAKFANDVTITATGSMIGSPAYMSPEHVRCIDLDSRSDLFSLGIVLYEILCGQKPFPGENYQEVITKILAEEPKSLLQIAPELSVGLVEIVHRLLAKEKIRRYQNSEDLLMDLKRQHDFYEIQLAPILISEYLAHPTVISHRLVQNRIQRHLDWGIHYFNQGPARKEEAKKEFAEVLRWDKENSIALKYLTKIEKEYMPGAFKRWWMQFWGKKGVRWTLVPAMLVLAVITGSFFGAWVEKSQAPGTVVVQRPGNLAKKMEEETGSGFLPKKTETTVSGKPSIIQPGTKPESRGGEQRGSGLVLLNPENEKDRVRLAGKVSQKELLAGIEYGTLKVNAKPKAQVEINGRVYGSVPPALTIKAEEGKYRVNLKQKGYRTESKKIYVQKGKTLVIDESLKKEEESSRSRSDDF